MSDKSDALFKTILTSSGILIIGLAFRMGLGFLGRVVIARFLGKVNYGSVSLGLTLMMTTSVLVVVGIDNGIGRYLPRYDERHRRRGILMSAFQIVVPIAFLVGLLIVVFADVIASDVFHTPELTEVIRIFGITIPFAAFVRLTVGSIRGMQEALPRVYIENIALPISRFALIAAAVILGFESVGIAWAYAGAYGLAATLSLFYLWKKTPLLERTEFASMHRELLLFSAPLMVSATMNIILSNLDTFMLGVLSSPGEVGIYNVAYPLANLLTILLTAFNFVFMPTISELQSNGEYQQLGRVYHVVSKWVFVFTLPIFIVLAFYPQPIIRLTFGPEYIDGGFALTILAIGFFTHTVVGPTGNTLMAVGRSQLIMYANIIVASVNTVLNILLIPEFSFVGAAIATTIGYITMNSIYIIYLNKELGIHPFRAEVFRPGLIAIALWIGIYLTSQQLPLTPLVSMISSIILFGPLYAIVILRFGGVESEELALLRSLESKIGVDLNPLRKFAKRFMG
ncbi:flippase [Haladaptatus caseinilyticus]|uniref:flippase n=1 Tax=Haladaptatus caseinilyticus TaxID=2993314 RepID=UPI00224B9048|nr:flippase [Haladaptatus caseinilyticus]